MSDIALPDDDELLAAELAFGLIEGEERRAAQLRLDRDPPFAAAYDRWLAYGAAMFTDVGEAPRPSIWAAIEAKLPANDAASRASGPAAIRWWQAGTAVASAAALLLAVIALRPPAPAPAPISAPKPVAPLVAVLTGAQKGIVTVSYDSATGRITSASNNMDIGQHSPELWVIPADGKPRSLGLIAAGVPAWIKVPGKAGGALTPGVTLAVSVEPIGGSPTGQPTGPVILTGKLAPV